MNNLKQFFSTLSSASTVVVLNPNSVLAEAVAYLKRIAYVSAEGIVRQDVRIVFSEACVDQCSHDEMAFFIVQLNQAAHVHTVKKLYKCSEHADFLLKMHDFAV